MKKYLLVHLFNDRSGSPKVLSQVAAAIHENGGEVEIITSGHQDGFLSNCPGTRRKIFYKRSEYKLLTLFYYLISQAHLFFYSFYYYRKDSVFYLNTMMPFGAALAAKIMRKPIIYHVHETSIKPELLKKILRLIIKHTADRVVFVSNYLERVENFQGIESHTIYNALDHKYYHPPVKRIDNDVFNVLMVCSLKKYKGIFEFLAIAEKILKNPSIKFTLVLNAEQSEIEEYLSLARVSSNVRIFSRQSSLDRFYKEASLTLNLSRPDEWVETFGLTILESISYGVPVIAPTVGGPAEIITDGREGFLVSCYDSVKIVNTIQKIAKNPCLHYFLATNAYERAKDFEKDEFNRKVLSLLAV